MQRPTNTSSGSITETIAAFGNRETKFRYRSRDYFFLLSHGLFSSAKTDDGSVFLLKEFSTLLDNNFFEFLPCRILDAGSGTGVLGICAAGALSELSLLEPSIEPPIESLIVRAEDRDELGRIFTEFNAGKNNISKSILEAYAEPLLFCGGKWDLILSNVPAKAGLPVLEDFVVRSLKLLNPHGRVLMVAVKTLSGFFENLIKTHASLIKMIPDKNYTVFLFGKKNQPTPPESGQGMVVAVRYLPLDQRSAGSYPLERPRGAKYEPFAYNQNETPAPKDELNTAKNLFSKTFSISEWNPSYTRNDSVYESEKSSYRLKTVHGSDSFDRAGGESLAAMKLAVRFEAEILSTLKKDYRVLFWENDQGHFPVWAFKRYENYFDAVNILLAGRNILSLSASFFNLKEAAKNNTVSVTPAVDMLIDYKKLLFNAESSPGENQEKKFRLIAAFPKPVPETNRLSAIWEGLDILTEEGGLALLGFSSGEAESFDRKKQKGWKRMGSIKRNGFRALLYKKMQ